jgi:phage antirepressor YoqD-like protein
MARRPQTAGGKRTSLAMRAAKKHAPSNTGEDEEVDSHSSSAASSESEQQTDDGGGKQQAGAYEEADEVDTDEEVTSLTSPRAKITKNEFMAIHVRNTTTSKVFRAVKFLNTPSLIESTMTQMARVYDVKPQDYHTWRGLYQKKVIYAINNKRNSVYQDVKPKIKRTYEVRSEGLFDISN